MENNMSFEAVLGAIPQDLAKLLTANDKAIMKISFEAQKKQMEESIKELETKYATKEAIQVHMKNFADQTTKILLSSKKNEESVLKDPVEVFLKANMDSLCNGERKTLRMGFNESIRFAVGPMLSTSIDDFYHHVEKDTNIHSVSFKNDLFSQIKGAPTNADIIVWVNIKNKEGSPAFTVEGDKKPQVDYTYTKESSTAQMMAGTAKISLQMLKNTDYVVDVLKTSLMQDCYREASKAIVTFNKSGSPANPFNGLLYHFNKYSITAFDGSIINATALDAVLAAYAQIASNGGTPDMLILNPIDRIEFELLKDVTGRYISESIRSKLQSLQIIDTSAMTVGYFSLYEKRAFTVKPQDAFQIRFNESESDFQMNLISIRAEQPVHVYGSDIEKVLGVSDSFANIVSKIDTGSSVSTKKNKINGFANETMMNELIKKQRELEEKIAILENNSPLPPTTDKK